MAQLSIPERADTFSRWVAHYIAEQMAAAERAEGSDKSAAEERCFRSILTLWSHRGTLPNGMRPLEDFEVILDTLARLDPENPRPLWRSVSQQQPDEKGESAETIEMIDFIFSMDHVAREVIDMTLHAAVAKAITPETRLYLSDAIPAKSPGNLAAIRVLLKRFDRDDEAKDVAGEGFRRQQKQIEELGKFCEMCRHIRDGLQTELDALRADVEATPR